MTRDATDIPVSDDINAVLAHATYNDDCSNSCSNTAGVLDWTIDIPAGGQVVLTFSVTLGNTFPVGTTELPNVVVVTGPGSNCPARRARTPTATPTPRSACPRS